MSKKECPATVNCGTQKKLEIQGTNINNNFDICTNVDKKNLIALNLSNYNLTAPSSEQRAEPEPPLKNFIKIFCPTRNNYGVQSIIGGTWHTKNKTLSDIAVRAHLDGKYYVSVRAGWYPAYGLIDIDKNYVTNNEDIFKVANKLNFSDGSYLPLQAHTAEHTYYLKHYIKVSPQQLIYLTKF